MPNKTAIVSFYSFVKIQNTERLLPQLLLIGKKKLLKGTILLAHEGFNGSVAGSNDDVMLLVNELIRLTSAVDVSVKVNYATQCPFQKFKVKLKPEIIAMNVPDLDINLKGEYVLPCDWDAFINKEDVITIDTRNEYEVAVGTFKGAINPNTDTFKTFPDWVKNNKDLLSGKKIAMYCTGGIRCEKSTAYLKMLGFNEVYHLKGGILQYLEDTQNKHNIWQGECFVFDDRRAVADDLSPAEGYWLKHI